MPVFFKISVMEDYEIIDSSRCSNKTLYYTFCSVCDAFLMYWCMLLGRMVIFINSFKGKVYITYELYYVTHIWKE